MGCEKDTGRGGGVIRAPRRWGGRNGDGIWYHRWHGVVQTLGREGKKNGVLFRICHGKSMDVDFRVVNYGFLTL